MRFDNCKILKSSTNRVIFDLAKMQLNSFFSGDNFIRNTDNITLDLKSLNTSVSSSSQTNDSSNRKLKKSNENDGLRGTPPIKKNKKENNMEPALIPKLEGEYNCNATKNDLNRTNLLVSFIIKNNIKENIYQACCGKEFRQWY